MFHRRVDRPHALTAALLPAALITLIGAAGPASAASLHYYSYEPDSDFARHRTQDVVLTVKVGLLGGVRVLHLNRTRGDHFDLRLGGPWAPADLRGPLGPDARFASLYQVDPKAGAGFAYGACNGASKAWLALIAPRPFQPLRIVVLTQAPKTRKAVLCEVLDYRWRAEWELRQRNLPGIPQNDEAAPAPKG
jgi:hypothetical protein